MTSNQIAYWTLEETKRANLAKEKELNRHQVADEKIRDKTNRITENLGQLNYSESVRSHTTDESERNRANLAKEALTAESNAINYGNLQSRIYEAGSGRIQAQAAASNAATRAGELVESNRTNLANENLKQQQIDELSRHNFREENLTQFRDIRSTSTANTNATTNRGQLEEQSLHNRLTEAETKRNNLTNQYLESLRQQFNIENESSKRRIEILNGSLGNAGKLLTGGRLNAN